MSDPSIKQVLTPRQAFENWLCARFDGGKHAVAVTVPKVHWHLFPSSSAEKPPVLERICGPNGRKNEWTLVGEETGEIIKPKKTL